MQVKNVKCSNVLRSPSSSVINHQMRYNEGNICLPDLMVEVTNLSLLNCSLPVVPSFDMLCSLSCSADCWCVSFILLVFFFILITCWRCSDTSTKKDRIESGSRATHSHQHSEPCKARHIQYRQLFISY